MELQELHKTDRAVSAVSLFMGEEGLAMSMRIRAGERLKEHVTKVPALLLCVSGKATFDNVLGESQDLVPGRYVKIAPDVVHWLDAHADSHFVLMR